MSIVAFHLQDFIENKNGRHPDCIEAARKHGVIKQNQKQNYLYIEQSKLPAICGEFKKRDVNSKGCAGCFSGQSTPSLPKDPLKEELEKAGIKWGDAVSWVAKRLGIPECNGCAVRKEVLNNVKKLGWAEALKQIKDTIVSEN